MPFQKGHKLATGGARAGAGRPSDWLRDKCQELFKKNKLAEFIADVASGEYTEFIVSPTGIKTELKKSADAKDRMKAAEMLKDWGYGKAMQAIDLDPKDTGRGNFVVILPEGTK